MASAARGRKKSSSATSSDNSAKTYGLEKIGLKKLKGVYRNLSVPTLIETAANSNDRTATKRGAGPILF